MKKLASVAFVVALSAGSLNLARADQPGPDWMPAEQVKQKVLQSGYTQVTKLEADDGRWEGEGIKNARRAFTPTARGLRRSNRPPSEHYPGKAFDSLDHRPPSVDGGGSG